MKFYVLFNGVLIISGRWEADNERLCAMKPVYGVEHISPEVGIELGTARSVRQRFIH